MFIKSHDLAQVDMAAKHSSGKGQYSDQTSGVLREWPTHTTQKT